jgi:MYXO-CTERM domain-containing protein
MKNQLIKLLALLLWATAMPAVQAIPMLSISPNPASVTVGGTTVMDVNVSGLTTAGEIVSGFDLDLHFNGALLGASAVDYNFGLFGGSGSVFSDVTYGAGLLQVFLTSDLLDDDIAALQGDVIRLFSFTLTGMADGSSLISFGADPDFERAVLGRGLELLNNDVAGACVAVGDGTCRQVPEPRTDALLGLAMLAMLAATGWRRRQSI